MAQRMRETCSRCGGIRDGASPSWCKACSAAYQMAWNRANPEARAVAVARYRAKHPDRYRLSKRQSQMRASYGIDLADYQEMLLAQGGACAICDLPETESQHQRLFVDHAHGHGGVRGLLCRDCNFMIGLARDEPERLRRAAEYLARPTQVFGVI